MVLKSPVISLELDCVHHWVIEVASGSLSSGTCLKCQENRMFKNSISKDHFWLNEPPHTERIKEDA